MNLSMIHVKFVISGANGKDMCDRITLVYHKENLAVEIYLHMKVAGVLWKRRNCRPKRFKFTGGQLAGSFASLNFLKSNQCMAGCRIEDSVDRSSPITQG